MVATTILVLPNLKFSNFEATGHVLHGSHLSRIENGPLSHHVLCHMDTFNACVRASGFHPQTMSSRWSIEKESPKVFFHPLLVGCSLLVVTKRLSSIAMASCVGKGPCDPCTCVCGVCVWDWQNMGTAAVVRPLGDGWPGRRAIGTWQCPWKLQCLIRPDE